MPAFQYRAADSQGKEHQGIIEADSARNARQLLRDRGLLPLDIKATYENTASKKNTPKITTRQRLDTKELALITRQFATLLSAGLPIEEVINTVAEQTEKQKTRALMLSVRSKVLEGHALASAMRYFPNAFSDLYCSTIAAGEKSGHLDIILQRLADYTEQQYNMRQKISHALIYPIIMICVAIGITSFLLEYVVPKMIAVYSNTGQTLPTMTKILIRISQDIKNFGLYFIAILVIGIFLIYRYMKSNISFRTRIHQFFLKIPVIGYIIRTVNTARFSRTFAILSGAGVSVLEAMNIASALITNLPIRTAIENAVKHVREGASIHLALRQTTYFAPMSIHMIASGEATGQLENMLERVSLHQETEMTRLIETLLTLFEPAIILIMGSVILFIVLAVLLPIFQLDQFTQ